MLSLEKLRKLLGAECTLSDEELLRLRDELYSVAEILISLAEAEDSKVPEDTG